MLKDEGLDEGFRKALEDYFQGWDLVDFLNIPPEDVIDAFEDLILEREEELKDYIDYSHDEVEEDDDRQD